MGNGGGLRALLALNANSAQPLGEQGGHSLDLYEESSRMWSTASFVGVLIIIGLPLWWKTTEVYRVALPYDEIAAFKNEPNVITTELTILAYDEPTAAEVKGLVVQAFEGSDILNIKITSSLLPKSLHDSINSSADDDDALELVCETLDCGRSNHLYLVQRRPLSDHVWLADERVVLFRDSLATPTLIKVLQEWIYAEVTLRGSREERSNDPARKTRFAPASGYRLVTTVVHPTPQEMAVEFDAGQAVEDYIGTFVDELSLLHNFTLKSQWLHLMEFDFQAKQINLQTTDPIEWNRYFAVKQSRLHLLLTHAEERTASRVSELPTINLLLYVMPCHTSPVRIVDNNYVPIQSPVEAFMSPKWGGVFMASPPFAVCRDAQDGGKPTWRPSVRLVMGTFVAQLRSLLGIVEAEHIEGAYLDPLRSVKPRKWEVDSLMRIRTLEQLVSAQLTLQSLAQLLEEIPNIVINDEVGASIKGAVASIQDGRRHLFTGALEAAHTHSQRGFLSADSAFTHPTLLALLYFPHDQKYAIYIPLFMPVMFPVLLSLKNLLNWIRGKKPTKHKTD